MTGTGSLNMPTGHGITTSPTAVGDWDGGGGVVLVNLSNPSAPFNDAYLDGNGAVVGDAFLIQVKFTANANVSNTGICIIDALASDGVPQAMATSINANGQIETADAP
jgi:hypothetical protein